MKLEPKQKGDHVKGNIRFSLCAPTSKDIEELGVDLTSKIARNLIAYIAFSAADALVRLQPKSAHFECEAEITVLNLCFIFIIAVVIPFGSPPDLFEVSLCLSFSPASSVLFWNDVPSHIFLSYRFGRTQ